VESKITSLNNNDKHWNFRVLENHKQALKKYERELDTNGSFTVIESAMIIL